MVTIKSTFIGNFKLGDNIVHNLAVLELLYRLQAAANAEDKELLRKPIIILLVSIIEAVLYDLHQRITLFTVEGVQNILASSVAYIRGLKRMDEFQKLLVSAKKHDLLDQAGTTFYSELDDLRKLRNRVHVQNKNGDFEPDEPEAFSAARQVLAEKSLERTLRTMVKKFPRKHNFVGDFSFPWEAHFPKG